MPFKPFPLTCLIFLALCQFHSSSGESVLSLVNQEKACAEFETCMTKAVKSKDGIKLVNLGPDSIPISVDDLLCALESKCLHQQRLWCEPHLGPNGTIQMKLFCRLTWASSEETDPTDSITSFVFIDEQKPACASFEKCNALPNEGFKALKDITHDDAVGHIPSIAKQILCSIRTNCLREMVTLCNEERIADMGHRVGRIVSVFCALYPYRVMEPKNPIGSRSLGGASFSKKVMSDVCRSPKDGVCSLD